MYYIMECRYRSYTSSSHNKFLNPRFIYCTYNSIRFGENPQLQMNWLRLRNNLLKFKTAGYYRSLQRNLQNIPDLIKENRWMSTCNRLALQTLGSQPVIMLSESSSPTSRIPPYVPVMACVVCWMKRIFQALSVQTYFFFPLNKGLPYLEK